MDKSADKIVKTVKTTGAVDNRSYPLPTHKKILLFLRSPHVNKKSREQFKLSSYKRLMDIYSSSSKTIDALMKLELQVVLKSKSKSKNMSGLIGRKIGMTSLFDEKGKNIPCTIIEADHA